jgi:phosphatidylserine/phosphatidylglycerophosphate/cardiolipin synthase-like enzyme
MGFIQPVMTFRGGRLGLLGILVVGFAVVLAGWLGQGSRTPPRPHAVQVPDLVAPPLVTGPQTVQPVMLLADSEYLPRMLAVLASAQRSIDVTMFSCVLPVDARPDHPVRRLLEALVARAQAGVAVRVVLDHGVPPSRRQADEEVPSEAAATWLAARSIAVRWDEDDRTTHTKSLVVDGRWCVVGSTNWTFSALRRNREQSLLLDDPVLAATLTTQFTALWKRATPVPSPAQR